MAKMIDAEPTLYQGERFVYNALKTNLPDGAVVYYNREVHGKEFDFCLLLKDLGLVIIEVKGWRPEHIQEVRSPDLIYLRDREPVNSPKKQARSYAFELSNLFQTKYKLNLPISNFVCYPFLSEVDYRGIGLNIVSEPEFTIFNEDLKDESRLLKKIADSFRKGAFRYTDRVSGRNYDTIRFHFENVFDPREEEEVSYSSLRVFHKDPTTTEIDEIFLEYAKGVKQILFFPTLEALDNIAKRLASFLDAAGIFFNGDQFVLKDGRKNEIVPKRNKVECFVLEAYCIADLANETRKDILVVNGRTTAGEAEVLSELSRQSTFNYEQYRVEHADPTRHIKIAAGAGTGKTYSMISRISFLVNRSSGSRVFDLSEEIAMLTFTVDAATNMKSRLKKQFINYFSLTKNPTYLELVSSIERMRVSTIHSFAQDIMKKTSLPLGIGSDFATVSGRYEKERILKTNLGLYFKALKEEEADAKFSLPVDFYKFPGKILDFAARLYAKGCDVRTVDLKAFGTAPASFDCFNDFFERVIRKTEQDYYEYLLKNNLVDLEQYMIQMNRCVEDESFNPHNWPFKFFFIDEFQDVDDAQIKTFLAMQEKLGFRFFIVGDLKQSIYRFRGATLDAFSRIMTDKNEWLSFTLQNNYRSEKDLLNSFDKTFRKMYVDDLLPYGDSEVLKGVKNHRDNRLLVERINAEVLGENKKGVLSPLVYDYLFKMAKQRCDEINGLIADKCLKPSEKTVAILTRTNAEVALVLREGNARGVPILSDKNVSLYRLEPTRDLYKLTNALCNPRDPVILFELLMSNNVGAQLNAAGLNGRSTEEKLDILTYSLDGYFQMTMQLKWRDILKKAKAEPVLKILHEIYERNKPWVRYSHGNPDKQKWYRENYDLLFENFARMNKKAYLTLDAINEHLFVAISAEFQASSREFEDNSEEARIVCTTIHKSKGLEYDTVILPFTSAPLSDVKNEGMEVTFQDGKVGYQLDFAKGEPIRNDYFPIEAEMLEKAREEARVAYVALTRAINHFVWVDTKKATNKNTLSTYLEAMTDAN